MPDPITPPAPGSSAATPDFRQMVADAVAAADRNPHRVAKALLQRIQTLEQKLETAVPKDAVVLTGDDAKAWEVLKGLGKPEEVKAGLAERDTLKATLAARDTAEARRKAGKAAASALGWNADVTVDLITDKGYTVELREVEVEEKDGKGTVTKVKKSLPHVITGEGTAAKAELLDAVITRDHAGYLPALQATAGGSGSGAGGNGGGSNAAGNGGTGNGAGATGRTITWPSGQRSGGSGGGATSAVDEALEKNRERAQAPNALRPAKASA